MVKAAIPSPNTANKERSGRERKSRTASATMGEVCGRRVARRRGCSAPLRIACTASICTARRTDQRTKRAVISSVPAGTTSPIHNGGRASASPNLATRSRRMREAATPPPRGAPPATSPVLAAAAPPSRSPSRRRAKATTPGASSCPAPKSAGADCSWDRGRTPS